MSLTDIAHRINELASSWEQFKLINDRKLKEIESKGRADSATIEQLCKVNNAIPGFWRFVNPVYTKNVTAHKLAWFLL
nr:hypothetical protein [Wolbachia endosymbiont of Glossina morsitans morsitans]